MALPAIMRRLFAGDGYGPLLKDDIVSKRISIQDWSSSFDYQPATAVRGSDGKPYWSAAQSGPNAGGAADPTTDDGTHWVRLPSMADIAAQGYATQGWVAGQNYATQGWVGNQGYATQAWVKASATAPIYVDASKPAGNDGTTPETAVKTFAEAIAIGKQKQNMVCVFIVAGGTYAETVNFSKFNCEISFTGDVTISGGINVIVESHVNCSGLNYTLTTSSLSVDVMSSFTTNTDVVIVGNSESIPLKVNNRSYFYCQKSCSVTGTSCSQTVVVTYGSAIALDVNLTCTSNSVSGASIYLAMDSSLFVGGNIAVNGVSSAAGVILNGGCKLRCINITVADIITTGCGLLLENSSLIIIAGIATINGSSNAPAVYINNMSWANIVQLIALGKWSGDGSALLVNVGSNMKTTHLDTRSSVSCGAVLTVARVASLEITNFSNTCTAPNYVSGGGVLCSENGVVRFLSGNTYGSVNGQKYYLYGGGKIFLGGATDARLPGTGGFCETSSFAFIGR